MTPEEIAEARKLKAASGFEVLTADYGDKLRAALSRALDALEEARQERDILAKARIERAVCCDAVESELRATQEKLESAEARAKPADLERQLLRDNLRATQEKLARAEEDTAAAGLASMRVEALACKYAHELCDAEEKLARAVEHSTEMESRQWAAVARAEAAERENQERADSGIELLVKYNQALARAEAAEKRLEDAAGLADTHGALWGLHCRCGSIRPGVQIADAIRALSTPSKEGTE